MAYRANTSDTLNKIKILMVILLLAVAGYVLYQRLIVAKYPITVERLELDLTSTHVRGRTDLSYSVGDKIKLAEIELQLVEAKGDSVELDILQAPSNCKNSEELTKEPIVLKKGESKTLRFCVERGETFDAYAITYEK